VKKLTSDQIELFSSNQLPEGFVYRADLISVDEEQQLARAIQELAFAEIKMRGVVAKRRTIHFGWSYDFQTFRLGPAPEVPAFLLPLRSRAGEFSHVPPEHFAEVLVTQYQSGAGIGWHRDAPQFGIVVGISLLSECIMQFRPWPVTTSSGSKAHRQILAQPLARRSAYVLGRGARQKWQHRIPATNALRYSVTFRTVRGGFSPGDANAAQQ
jgi:alkylated DNA repair dioxygenase AlkB